MIHNDSNRRASRSPLVGPVKQTDRRRLLLTLATGSASIWLAIQPVHIVAADTPADKKSTRPILVLGDSLSASYGLQRGTGWVDLLAKRVADTFSPNMPVINASISGDTTAGGRTRLPALLIKHRPAIVVVELGGNDALRGLDLKMTEVNLRAMLAESKKAGASTLLLGMMLPPNYGKAYGDRFSGVFKTAAQSEQSAQVPFLLEGIAQRNDLFQTDRIHPTEQAQPYILDNVWPALEPLIRAVKAP